MRKLQIVRLKSEVAGYADLSPRQRYFVLGIEADDYRVLNDSGRPYLYPPDIFEVIGPGEPEDWVTDYGADGERYSYPPQMNAAGFFEDFFDQKDEQTAVFWRVVNLRLAQAA